jgi:hypothetical protein
MRSVGVYLWFIGLIDYFTHVNVAVANRLSCFWLIDAVGRPMSKKHGQMEMHESERQESLPGQQADMEKEITCNVSIGGCGAWPLQHFFSAILLHPTWR